MTKNRKTTEATGLPPAMDLRGITKWRCPANLRGGGWLRWAKTKTTKGN
jgi:hypothetical protein